MKFIVWRKKYSQYHKNLTFDFFTDFLVPVINGAKNSIFATEFLNKTLKI